MTAPKAIRAQVRETFRQEAGELLLELDDALLKLELRPEDKGLVNQVFRAMHTIKGSGGATGFPRLAGVAHQFETAFSAVRDGQLALTSEVVDAALKGCDLIGKLLLAEDEDALAAEVEPVIAVLRRLLPRASTAPVLPALPAPQKGAPHAFEIVFTPAEDLFLNGTEPANLLDELRALGECRVTLDARTLPPFVQLQPLQCHLSWRIRLVSSAGAAAIDEVFSFVAEGSRAEVSDRGPCTAAPSSGQEALPPEVLEDFFAESAELARGIGAALRGLEQAPGSRAEVDELFRHLHSLKGGAGLVLSQKLVPLPGDHPLCLLLLIAHALETLVDELRARTPLRVPAEAHGLLVAGAGLLAQQLAALQGARKAGPIDPALLARLGLPALQVPAAAAPPVAEAPVKAAPPAPEDPPAAGAGGTVRVDQEKLDRLMQLVGELLVVRGALPAVARKVARQQGLATLAKEVGDAGAHVSRLADELQAMVMSLRMLPIGTVFQKYPRMVRDLARVLRKEVTLVTKGDTIELDKTILEKIGDPLVHAIRNAVDHGIEPAAERVARGKPPAGTITVSAFAETGQVVIEVVDDGRGADTQAICRKAVEKGLLTAQAAAALDDEGALDLLFEPGFSLAAKVTDVSGRGVGMDVVRSRIEALHGTVALTSKPGEGMRLSVRLPTNATFAALVASLLVTRGIVVEAGGSEYLLPFANIVEMVKIAPSTVRWFRGRAVALLGKRLCPLLTLGVVFGRAAAAPRGLAAELCVVVVHVEGTSFGVVVDRFVGEAEALIKPLDARLKALRLFRGATIMGDGRVVLVVDPEQLALELTAEVA